MTVKILSFEQALKKAASYGKKYLLWGVRK